MIARRIGVFLLIALLGACGRPAAPRNAQPAPEVPVESSADQRQPTAAPGATTASVAAGAVTRGSVQGAPSALTTGCAEGTRTNFNPALSGVVTAADGSTWTVPAPTSDGAAAVDFYNDCTGQGDNAGAESQLQTVVIDQDGVDITGYIFADNYFELTVNGQFVARDTIGFTPFNASVVRFKAKYPITYAVKLVDWESHLGLGMEYDEYKVGDGGFIALFSDGTRTSSEWRAQQFYIAPLDDPACVTTAAGPDSTGCAERPACADRDPESCQALHIAVPADWAAPAYDDAGWSPATEWEAAAVTNAPAYARYADRFGAARFIWTANLRLDNLVLARYTAQGPQ